MGGGLNISVQQPPALPTAHPRAARGVMAKASGTPLYTINRIPLFATRITKPPPRNSRFFSKCQITPQTTSDWPEILCGILIPPQLPPYNIPLKTHEPISLCPQKGPLRQCHSAPNVPRTCTTSPRPAPGSKASPKSRVQIA